MTDKQMISPNLYRPFQPTLTAAGLKRFELSLKYTAPCSLLKNVVHSYLQIDAAKPTPYPVIPDGTQAIFIAPSGSLIGGAMSKAHEVQILQPGTYFGIRFQPGALRHFFNLNLSEITDQFVDNRFFPCQKFNTLHDNIYLYQRFFERVQIAEQWLLEQHNPQSVGRFEHALSLVYQSLGNIKINQLANTIGWSSRHLNRVFRCHTGLSTKTFVQTIRMQHTCKQLYIKPDNSLNITYKLGFFDQSHLINDYKKRLLTSPRLFYERFK